MNHRTVSIGVIMLCALAGFVAIARAEDKTPASAPASRPAPKAISDNVKKGLAYLARTQLANGAWAQGDESAAMGNAMDNIKGSPNVADTCMAVMALLRGGSSPTQGEYKENILKGVNFVCEQIQGANDKDLYITSLRGTRTQMKLGSCIDTFVAAQLLGEIKKIMPDEPSTRRVNEALAKVLDKIEKNQRPDGRWASDGWAPVLAQGQAAKALNVVMQNGGQVNEKTRAAAETVARADFNNMSAGGSAGSGSVTVSGGTVIMGGSTIAATTLPAGSLSGTATYTGPVSISRGDAGVELYSRAAQVAAMQASANTNAGLRESAYRLANSATTSPAAKAEANSQLLRFAENDKDLAKAQDALVVRLQDQQFVAGFGSNGGEEFLSYLNIGESLFLRAGDAWDKWDKSMTENINRIQNGDGSWSGHHCITGRTFCTSAALMVLTIDRSPTSAMPAIDKSRGGK